MRILTARWTEPCDGNAAWLIYVTDEEAQQIEQLITWLEEHAGQDHGHTLAEWDLHPSRSKGTADLTGLDAVLDEIALNSRYNETDTPGDFYNATHSLLDGR